MSKPVDVRNKLADKALELFNANGYEKTSVNSICAASNVSRTRFYSLFSDKKDLIMWTMRDASLESNIEPSEILFLDNDFERMIYIFALHTPMWTKDNVNYCKTLLKLEVDERLGIFDFVDAYNELYYKLLSNCQKNGIIRNLGKPEILVKYSIQIAKATLLDWCCSNAAFDFHEAVRTGMEEYYDVAPAYRKSR